MTNDLDRAIQFLEHMKGERLTGMGIKSPSQTLELIIRSLRGVSRVYGVNGPVGHLLQAFEEVAEMLHDRKMVVTIRVCSSCGKEHCQMSLLRWIGEGQVRYWGICPENLDPLYWFED